jgi:3-deoxy-D-manno-octulosonic-acid transferase
LAIWYSPAALKGMRFLYNILFTLGFCVSAPFYFLKMWRRGSWRRGFSERFGRYRTKTKQAITNRHVLWMHAVSVGEVNLCTHLVRAIEQRLPNLKIIVSTTTSTGMGELHKKLPSHIEKIYYPIDRFARRAVITLNPEAIVLIEAEIWPNFLWAAYDKRIPTFLVNARLSQKSYRGYKLFGFLFRRLFASFHGVGCQNEADAARLRSLGCREDAVHVVGSLKFDAAKLEERKNIDIPALMRQVGMPAGTGGKFIVAGSTHAGEEKILGEVFLRLRRQFPDLFLIIVPRHFERGKEVGRDLQSAGVKFYYRSDIGSRTQLDPGEVDCLVVNTTGELKYFYEQADLIFVGKSLTAEGGQNPIEPGALGKAMVFGPNMQNFEAIANAFVDRDAAVRVPNAEQLEKAMAALLADKSRREQLGRNAIAVVRENTGAIERTVEMIVANLDDGEIYVAPKR